MAAGLLFPFVGAFIYLFLRPPEYLADVRERELPGGKGIGPTKVPAMHHGFGDNALLKETELAVGIRLLLQRGEQGGLQLGMLLLDLPREPVRVGLRGQRGKAHPQRRRKPDHPDQRHADAVIHPERPERNGEQPRERPADGQPAPELQPTVATRDRLQVLVEEGGNHAVTTSTRAA